MNTDTAIRAVKESVVTIRHEHRAVFRFRPSPPFTAGDILPAGLVLPSRDARITLASAALVNAIEYTGCEWVVYYTYQHPAVRQGPPTRNREP